MNKPPYEAMFLSVGLGFLALMFISLIFTTDIALPLMFTGFASIMIGIGIAFFKVF